MELIQTGGQNGWLRVCNRARIHEGVRLAVNCLRVELTETQRCETILRERQIRALSRSVRPMATRPRVRRACTWFFGGKPRLVYSPICTCVCDEMRKEIGANMNQSPEPSDNCSKFVVIFIKISCLDYSSSGSWNETQICDFMNCIYLWKVPWFPFLGR